MLADSLILTDGTIYTMDPAQPRVRNLAVAGGWYPEQRLSLEEAIRAYTVGSATAERGQPPPRGMLAEGMAADVMVLTPEPFPRPPEAMLDARVALTMVDGRITFIHGDL
jgi:predicted amidohydrolase YtcJ